MTFTHPIAKQCETWWHEHGGRAGDPAWRDYLTDVAHLTERKIDEQSAEHNNQGRYGMSRAGGCTRAASLRLLGAPEEPFSGSTRVTFFIGHLLEVAALATLKAIGIPVSPSTADGVQWTARIDPFMLSFADGMIDVHNDKKTVVSIKSAGYKMSGRNRDGSWKRYGFAQYPMDGVKRTSPGYWAQMQAEMAGTNSQQALLLVVAKDMIKAMENDPILARENGSLSFYAEMIQRDDGFIESLKRVWGKQWEKVQGGDPGAPWYLTVTGDYVCLDPTDRTKDGTNKLLTGTFNPCNYCSVAQSCAGGGPTWPGGGGPTWPAPIADQSKKEETK